MASSTSSSDPHDGMVERGYDRPVPATRWGLIALVALVLALAATAAWELAMRAEGLHAGDLDDGNAAWAVERRKIDSGPADPVVIVGDSRSLFDTNFDVWQSLTGRRPIQLGREGTSALPVLEDLASDAHFRGFLVVGFAPAVFFGNRMGEADKMLRYLKSESPSQYVSHQLFVPLAKVFAFLDDDYSLFKVIERRPWDERAGLPPPMTPYGDVWKLREVGADRQYVMWPRVEADPYVQKHAKMVWDSYAGPKVPDAALADVIARTRASVDKIRARGGEVVFLRPPSSGSVYAHEREVLDRASTWDRLLAETHSVGFHFEDDPVARAMVCPENSHLSGADAKTFTMLTVRAYLGNSPWLRAHARAGAVHEPADRG